jgi:hypothetical protein
MENGWTTMTHARRTFTLALLLVSLAPLSKAADGAYLASLVSKYPSEGADSVQPNFFQVPSIRASFQRIVPSSVRRSIVSELVVGTPNGIIEGYLVVSGCKPHNCPSKNYIAIASLSDASVAFIFYDDKSGTNDSTQTHCYSSQSELREFPGKIKSEILGMHIPLLHSGDRLYDSNAWIDEVRCGNGSTKSLERTSEK